MNVLRFKAVMSTWIISIVYKLWFFFHLLLGFQTYRRICVYFFLFILSFFSLSLCVARILFLFRVFFVSVHFNWNAIAFFYCNALSPIQCATTRLYKFLIHQKNLFLVWILMREYLFVFQVVVNSVFKNNQKCIK